MRLRMHVSLARGGEGGIFGDSVADQDASHRALARVLGKASRSFIEDACVELVELCQAQHI